MPKPLAVWNSARDVWEKPQPKLPDRSCAHLDVFSGTLPTSGMTLNGEAYALPTWEHAIPDSASLSSPLFGTPTARMWKGSGPVGSKSHEWLIDHGNLEAQVLLPTVRTSDTNGVGRHGDGGLDLRTTVSLLPSPRATDGTKGGPNQRGSKGDLMLPSQTVALMQTPSKADGDGGHTSRSGDRKAELLLGGQAKALTGTNSSQPSDAGNESPDAPLPGQLSLPGVEEQSA